MEVGESGPGPPTIEPLPASTTSLLRSTLVVPSFPSILTELVQNSLDARSTSITLVVSLSRWSISCQDDGCGMSREDLRLLGRDRYLTSKLGAAEGEGGETFGFRGEALASIADVSLLELLTRQDVGSVEGESCSLVVRGGELVFEGVAKVGRPSKGTTVWVRDIYYKWPVRRRPFMTSSARQTLSSSIRSTLCTLSLLHPSVSFTLTEVCDTLAAEEGDAKRGFGVSKSSEGVLGRWRQLWGRAGVENVVEISHQESGGDVKIEGFFSVTASHSKASQFIFVNNRPIAPSPLHKLINTIFNQSTFSRHAASHLVFSPNKPHSHLSEQDDSDSATQAVGTKRSRKSPKKVTERYPIYVLHLIAPQGMVDVTLEPEKRVVEFQDEKRVHTFVEDVVKTFLGGQGWLKFPTPSPVAAQSRSEEHPPSPPPTKRIKEFRDAISAAIEANSLTSRSPSPNGSALQPIGPTVFPRKITSSKIDESVVPSSSTSPAPSPPPIADDQPLKWTDPSTLQTYLIDPRTGNSWRPRECHSCSPPEDRPSTREMNEKSTLVDRTSLKKSGRTHGEEKEKPEWMRRTLEQWENPIFPRGETLIPSLRTAQQPRGANPLPSPDPILPTPKNRRTHVTETLNLNRSEISTITAFFNGAGASDLTDSPVANFSRSSLRNAEFVAQVDQKFLLVRLTPAGRDGEKTLVMVDQHAADERVRVERFWEDLLPATEGGRVKVWKFEQPPLVVISRSEAVVVEENLDEFERWGIGIKARLSLEGQRTLELGKDVTTQAGTSIDYVQVQLTTVPLVVAERLKIEVKLQQELIRSFAAVLANSGRPTTKGMPSSSAAARAALLRDCPPVVLDLVNSKACRGAIMFNDALTTTQATTLLERLSRTAFPFQCAHGRPSLTPLVNLPSLTAPTPTSIAGDRNSSIKWDRLEDL
ncbi:hypothetical protein T439DRAFT_321333 [Meredithblackwellia eburnea MCA 4105]